MWAVGLGGVRAQGKGQGSAPGWLPFLRSTPGTLAFRQFIVLGGWGEAGLRVARMLMLLFHIS